MPDFVTPLGLTSPSGQQWNINVVDAIEGAVPTHGSLVFNANSLTVGDTIIEIDDDTGNVGIGVSPPNVTKLVVLGDSIGISARANINVGLIGSSPNAGVTGFTDGGGIGVIGSTVGGTDGLAGRFFGDVQVRGLLCVDGFTTCLDSPLDPGNISLNHAGIVSSEMLNVYSGNTKLDENGEAWVELPNWFEALNYDFRYQLTCIGKFASVYIAEEVSGNCFKIAGGNPGMKLSWQLTGVRQDPWAQAHPLIVEEKRSANEQGYYQHPQLYDQPEEKGIDFARYPEIMHQLKEEEQRFLANT